MFSRILVVCTGNICRSPVAEALLRLRLPGKTVSSAGTMAMVGSGADSSAVAVGMSEGLDLSAHRAAQLTHSMLQEADLVLTLDSTHSDWITRRFPQYRGKVHKLGKWQQDSDVPDPYRRPKNVFESVHAQMASMVADWAARLS